ncbi:hypothetical protein T06_11774 [Trichinella sp. T6]|nr:hypothetical protein T06_11774 [Trichinella sp. T6]
MTNETDHKVTYFNLANPLEKVIIQKKLLHFKRHTCAIDPIMCSKLKRNTCYSEYSECELDQEID